MTHHDHPPEWPDKVIFAAMLVIIGGVLAALFALIRLTGAVLGEKIPEILLVTPPGITLLLGAAMILLGVYAIRHQAAIWVWIGIGAGVASMGMLGLVPFLSVLALGFLVLSRVEGEETTHDEHTVDASLWPDKALAASLLVLVMAVVSFFQAGLLFGDNLTAPGLPDDPMVMAFVGLLAGAWGLFAAHELYHVRRPWTGYVACVLGIASLGFWVLGPALAVAAVVLLVKAGQEDEFGQAGGVAVGVDGEPAAAAASEPRR